MTAEQIVCVTKANHFSDSFLPFFTFEMKNVDSIYIL